jgi:SAM-dependent methyltransferase
VTDSESPTGWPRPPLVCPGCRREGLSWRLGPDLDCANPACGARYPWLTPGIPAVAAQGVRERLAESDAPGPLPLQGGLQPMLAAVAPASPAFGPLARAAIFLRALRADGEEPFYGELCEALLPDLGPAAAVADLGCGAGNLAFEIARRAPANVAGIDLDAHLLRWAERAAGGEEFEAPVRIDAGRFAASPMRVRPGMPGSRLSFAAANVLDPPFEPGSFDLVTLVNVLDAVPYPAVALRQAVALLKPGGLVLFASPDSWNGGTTPPKRWLATTEAGWDRVFTREGLETLRRIDDLEWRLRDTPRLHHLYRVHGRLLQKR